MCHTDKRWQQLVMCINDVSKMYQTVAIRRSSGQERDVLLEGISRKHVNKIVLSLCTCERIVRRFLFFFIDLYQLVSLYPSASLLLFQHVLHFYSSQ